MSLSCKMTTFSLRELFLAGLIGELAFETYAWLLSPILFDVTLEPAKLVAGLVGAGLDIPMPYATAFAIHVLIGSLGFAFVVWLVHAVAGARLIISGAMAGFALWFVAQGMLAPLMGRPFMMSFGAYTQSSLVGHVGMTLVIGGILQQWARPRQAA